MIHEGGRWNATWGLRLPWAHPLWDDYLLLLYDLHKHPGERPPLIHMPGANFEFMLFAVAPETPIDFENSLFFQPKVAPLEPANLGYQFRSISSSTAKLRLGQCVRQMLDGKLSPDTDFRCMWDKLFEDGHSLVL